MAKQIIKIGTKVKVRFFGGETKIAKVTGIEKCECGEKYGEPVDEVEFRYRAGNFGAGVEYTFSLDDNHWCYGEQIIGIVE
jgi:hypothetical protein